MSQFKLVSPFQPMGDQVQAIQELVDGLKAGKKEQVLLGGTGTGKTFTVANVIKEYNKPALVLAHNKTLAGQLYSELKEFFPENRVEYFISNFDFYQPEAYIPGRDLYIDKNAKTNYEIEMLRSAAMNSLIEREDVIVVASVASIYGLGNPEQYKEMIFSLRVDQDIDRRELLTFLVDRQYQRNDIDWGYIEKESGLTNRQIALKGEAPYGIDGEKINLHHLTQMEPGAMVELPYSTHKKYHKVLHGLKKKGESFRNNDVLNSQYNNFRRKYWKWRANNLD